MRISLSSNESAFWIKSVFFKYALWVLVELKMCQGKTADNNVLYDGVLENDMPEYKKCFLYKLDFQNLFTILAMLSHLNGAGTARENRIPIKNMNRGYYEQKTSILWLDSAVVIKSATYYG